MMVSMMRAWIAALFVAAIVAVGCGHSPLRNPRIDPGIEKYIPPDTTMLFDAHVDRLRNSRVFQKYVSQLLRDQTEELARRTGIDPTRDIDELLSCSDGKNTIAVTRFAGHDVSARIRQHAGTPARYNGVDVYGDEQNAIAFPEPSIAVAGAVAAVHARIDSWKRDGSGRLPAALNAVVENIPPEDQIWAAMVGGFRLGDAQLGANPNFGNLVRLAQSIESASISMQLNNDAHLHGRADCRSEEDSRQVHDALRGFLALGRLAAPANRPELLKIYDAINVTTEKTVVRVTAVFSQQDLDTFFGLLLKNRPQR